MKKILVIIDMQNDFITGSLGSNDAQKIVPLVAQKIKSYKSEGCEIIFTRDTHSEDYLNTLEGKNLPVIHCVKNTNGWEIAKEISGIIDINACNIFDKPTFGSLQLAEYIKEKGVEEIELVGLVSSICVVSNALLIKAYAPETSITVDAICTAGVTKEDYLASLLVMKMNHINIINEVK